MSAISPKAAQFLIRSRIADASNGDAEAFFDLGVTYSSGRYGVQTNLVEAHKWFNLATSTGCVESHRCRAEISKEMTAGEIALAQRNARQWLDQRNRCTGALTSGRSIDIRRTTVEITEAR